MTATTYPTPPGTAAQRPPPRWGVQTGLRQPHQPAFWLFVVLVTLGVGYALLELLREALISPIGLALSWLLMLLYIVPVVLVLRWLDLYEREPKSLLIGAFLWGGLVAIMFAGTTNDWWGYVILKLGGAEFASRWSAALTAPVVEEIYKYAGLVVLFLIARTEFDDLLDGFVYGAMIGLGFAVVEDVFYFIVHFGGGVVGVLVGFFVRVILSGLYGHVTFTGISGVGFAYFVIHRMDRTLLNRLLVAAGLLLLAMAAHFIWNSPWLSGLGVIEQITFKGLPFFIGLFVLVYLARRREHQALADVLAGEVGKDGLLSSELDRLRTPRARRETRGLVRRVAGPQAASLMKQLQTEQLALALNTSGAEMPDDARLHEQRARINQLRASLWQLPGVAAALGISPDEVARVTANAHAFAPTKVVGPSGGWAWTMPDQADPRRQALAPKLPLQVIESRSPWLLVRAAGGFYGWTGEPYLTESNVP